MPSKILDDLVACKVPTETIAAVANLIAEVEQLRDYKASRREQNRKDKQKQRARQADQKSCQADRQADIKKPSRINGHVRLTNGESSSFFFLESERKKDSAKYLRDSFRRFYTAYPKHVGEGAAEKEFPRALKQATLEQMLAALERQRPNLPQHQYICAPVRWLREKRWLDEVVANKQRSSII